MAPLYSFSLMFASIILGLPLKVSYPLKHSLMYLGGNHHNHNGD